MNHKKYQQERFNRSSKQPESLRMTNDSLAVYELIFADRKILYVQLVRPRELTNQEVSDFERTVLRQLQPKFERVLAQFPEDTASRPELRISKPGSYLHVGASTHNNSKVHKESYTLNFHCGGYRASIEVTAPTVSVNTERKIVNRLLEHVLKDTTQGVAPPIIV